MPRKFTSPDAEAIWAELRGIRKALEKFLALTQQPEPEVPTCPHPEEQRLQIGASGTSWICQGCGHQEANEPIPTSPNRSDPETMIRDRLRRQAQ